MSSNSSSFFDRLAHWLRYSVSLKLITIGILILFLLIPVSLVQDLIREREYRKKDAIEEVSAKWADPQVVDGVALSIPYESMSKVYNESTNSYEQVKSTSYAHFLPKDLQIDVEIIPEKRYRGIFEVIVYRSVIDIKGSFEHPQLDQGSIDKKDIFWEEAFVSVGLTDLRGIQNDVSIQWDDSSYDFQPGVQTKDIMRKGISSTIPLNPDSSETHPFSMQLKLNGSASLHFTPLGQTTRVNMSSKWDAPSFNGAFLPDNRTIDSTGFTANWEVLHLNRPFPQQFNGPIQQLSSTQFGVDLIVPVDGYQKSTRSAKYAVLFIMLTFVLFFFIQIINRIQIHPIQYIMVGLALCVFYTLLIALSEHISFGMSYLIASFSTVSLITLYAHSFAKNNKVTLTIGGILSILYGFIYTILQLNDYALLIGSLGLFTVLATVMYLSRKIDWYALNK